MKGFPIGSAVRQQLNQMRSRDEMLTILGQLDDIPFPPDAARLTRGHSHGPRKVALPHGWLDGRDDPTPPGAAAAAYTSGG